MENEWNGKSSETLNELEDDSYWSQRPTTSMFLDNKQNDLWDGLFSPDGDDKLANLSKLNDDFKRQLSISSAILNAEAAISSDNHKINASKSSKTTPNNHNVQPRLSNDFNLDASSPPFSPNPKDVHSQASPFHLNKNKGGVGASSSHKSSSSKFTTNTAFSTCTREESSNSLELEEDSQHTTASELTVHLDYARLKAEHRKLRKYFDSAYDRRYRTPPVAETIQRLRKCEPVSLDLYRSKKEKMDLLDAALELDDWDVAVTVILFVKRTLDNSLFRQCLLEKPVAARNYVTYLSEAGEKQELKDTLYGLGRIADAAMLEFEEACRLKDPKRKLEALKKCLISGFHHPDLTNEKRHLEEWISLLETHAKAH